MTGPVEVGAAPTGVPGRRPMEIAPLRGTPLVSVLMPNHDYATFVGGAIDSVLAQTYPHLELIVCDDGSTDDSPAVIARRCETDARVRLLRTANHGQAHALNTAYRAATGAVVCLLDSDDAFAPSKVELVVDALARGGAGLLLHRLDVVDAGGRRLSTIPGFSPFEEGWIADRVVRRGGRWRYMPASAICMRRELADRLFPIDETPPHADGFLFLLAPLLAPVTSVPEVLGQYRVHGSNAVAGAALTPAAVERSLSSLEACLAAANRRLAAIAPEDVRLDPERHVDVARGRLLAGLLDANVPRRRLLRDWRRLTRALALEEGGAGRRAAVLLVYATAVALPPRLRPVLLEQTLHNPGNTPVARAAQRLHAGALRLRSLPHRLGR